MDRWWDDLGGADTARAYAAFRALLGAGDRAICFLADRLRPVPCDGRATGFLADLIDALDHDDICVRDRAMQELLVAGPAVEPVLLKALEQTRSPEVRIRLEYVLSIWGDLLRIPPGEPLRRFRAIQVLERQVPEAIAALAGLASAAPSLRERKEAQAALDRLRPAPAAGPADR